MGKLSDLILAVLFMAIFILRSEARSVPSAAEEIKNSQTEQTFVHVDAPAESPTITGLEDSKNFIYGGVGGFAGMGGYAGMVGGMPVLGGLGGIGKYGGLGGVGGIGGLGGGAGSGGAGGAPGGGLFPCP